MLVAGSESIDLLMIEKVVENSVADKIVVVVDQIVVVAATIVPELLEEAFVGFDIVYSPVVLRMPIKVGKLMFVLAVFDYVVVMTMNAPEVVGIVAAENVLLVHLFVVAVVANWPILVDLPIPNVVEVESLNRLMFQFVLGMFQLEAFEEIVDFVFHHCLLELVEVEQCHCLTVLLDCIDAVMNVVAGLK